MIDLKTSNRWLLVSLAINLFLLGFVVANLVRPERLPPPPPPPLMMLERMSENLTPEGQAAIRDLLAARRAKLEELRTAMIESRKRAIELFGQDPFDRAAFRQSSEQGFAAAQAYFSALEELLGEAGTRLSAEDRRRMRPFGPPPPPQ